MIYSSTNYINNIETIANKEYKLLNNNIMKRSIIITLVGINNVESILCIRDNIKTLQRTKLYKTDLDNYLNMSDIQKAKFYYSDTDKELFKTKLNLPNSFYFLGRW